MDINKFMQEQEKKFNDMVDVDAKAKEAGELIGRYIVEPFADGRAYYVVAKANKSNCVLDHVDIGDAWTLPFVESLDRKVPKRYVLSNIKIREAMEKMFGGKK